MPAWGRQAVARLAMRRGEFLWRGDVLGYDAPPHDPLDPIHRHLEVDSRLLEHGLGRCLLHLVVRRLLRLKQQVRGVLGHHRRSSPFLFIHLLYAGRESPVLVLFGEILLPRLQREVERGEAGGAELRGGVRLVHDEDAHGVAPSVPRCRHQRRPALVIGLVHRGAPLLNQERDAAAGTGLGRGDERRRARVRTGLVRRHLHHGPRAAAVAHEAVDLAIGADALRRAAAGKQGRQLIPVSVFSQTPNRSLVLVSGHKQQWDV
mmetsp:Transcript_3527/g.9056  ORF Transcript_3527/g.9056 Transcript_3527/m.9056 type:complete len:262 (+) Transcript_3527:336-1121(+)